MAFVKTAPQHVFFPLFSTVLQIEVYKGCGGGNRGAAFGSANAGAQESPLHARDLAPAGVRQGVSDGGWMKLRAGDTRATRELEAKLKLQWYVCAQGRGRGGLILQRAPSERTKPTVF